MISVKKLRKITEKGKIKKAKIRKKEIYSLEKHLLKEVKKQAKNGCNEMWTSLSYYLEADERECIRKYFEDFGFDVTLKWNATCQGYRLTVRW